MSTITAIDPGDRWTGVAFFDPADNKWGWECTGVAEFDGHPEFIDSFAETVLDNEMPICVFERWRLFEDKAEQAKGSEFETCQLIGQMKFVVRRHNEHCYLHTKAMNQGIMTTCELRRMSCMDIMRWQPTLMIGQMSDIQKPTAGILRGKGIKSVAKPIDKELYKGRGHVVSAELHGWHYILRGEPEGKGITTYYDG